MFVEPDRQDEPESEPIEAPVKSRSGDGSKKSLIVTILLAVLLAAAAGGAGYLFTELGKTKKTLAGTQSSLSQEKDKSATLEEEKKALTDEKAKADQDLAATKSALEAAGKELETAKADVDKALAALAEKEKREQDLNKQLEKLEKQVSDANQATSVLQGKLAEADGKIKLMDNKGPAGEDIGKKLESIMNDAKEKARLAAATQAEIDKMLGKAEAANLLRGTVASVNALEKLVVISLGDKSAPVGKQFVISNKEHQYLATVAMEVSEGNMGITRVLRPEGDLNVLVGDVAIEVPDSAFKTEPSKEEAKQ